MLSISWLPLSLQSPNAYLVAILAVADPEANGMRSGTVCRGEKAGIRKSTKSNAHNRECPRGRYAMQRK